MVICMYGPMEGNYCDQIGPKNLTSPLPISSARQQEKKMDNVVVFLQLLPSPMGRTDMV